MMSFGEHCSITGPESRPFRWAWHWEGSKQFQPRFDLSRERRHGRPSFEEDSGQAQIISSDALAQALRV